MASNDTTIANEYGDFSDWIEIYNADNIPHFLGNKYLTDNLSDRNKWKMPDIYLPANDFVLFWADDDADKGVYHTNFKLKASGEEIGIFDSDNTGFARLDTLLYGVQKQISVRVGIQMAKINGVSTPLPHQVIPIYLMPFRK
jgi:hypothetical protein